MRGSGGIRRRRRLGVLIALAAIALTIGAVPIRASAAPQNPTAAAQTATGSISGTVMDQLSRQPIAGDNVEAVNTATNTVYGPVSTDAGGNYTLSNLPVGSYQVHFLPVGSYVGLWWGPGSMSQEYAGIVNVTAGQTTTGINVFLYAYASVSGTITDASGMPIQGATITLAPREASLDVVPHTVTSGVDGTFTIANVVPFSYYVEVYDTGYVTVISGPALISSGQAFTIDIQLLGTATITGTVTGPDGQPLAGVQVTATDSRGQCVQGACPISTTTASDGTYTLVLDPTIPWQVQLSLAGYPTQTLGPFTLVGGQTTTANAQLGAAAPLLALTNSAPASVVSGKSFEYTLTTTNTGSAAATGVVLSDVLPANAHYVSVSTTQGTCARTASTTNPKTANGTVTCDVGNLGAGNSATVTIEMTPTKPSTLSNTATVSATNVTADADDTATATTTVVGT